jgi:hypothetical protein
MSLQRAPLGFWRRTSWEVRVVLAVLAADAALALAGMWVVPGILRWPAGLLAMLGVVAVQFAIAVAAVTGPMRVDKRPPAARICLAAGTLFALSYVGLLAADIAGIQLSFDQGPVTIYALFGGVSVLAGALVCRRATRLVHGAVAGCWALVAGTAIWSLGWVPLNYALWGGAHWYRFWQQDGAIADFHRQGGPSLGAFLLQDMYGAMVAHQVLSVVIGIAGGLVGGAIARVPVALPHGRLMPFERQRAGVPWVSGRGVWRRGGPGSGS